MKAGRSADPGRMQPPDAGAPVPMHPALAKLFERAAEVGWRCLAHTWQSQHTLYVFECPKGHTQQRTAAQLINNTPFCKRCRADAIHDRWASLLAERGGELVEGTFTVLARRYRLRCAKGHEWETPGRKIFEGSWCRRCHYDVAGQRRLSVNGLERLHAVAQARGGRCLATQYAGGSRHYPFECAEEHRWSAQGAAVLNGSWCPVCGRKATGAAASAHHFCHDGLQRLHEAAQRHGGTCLATEYVGSNEKYRFRCAHGHEWETKASQIWAGTWCVKCHWRELQRPIEDMHALARSRGGECLSAEYLGVHTKLRWRCGRGHEWSTKPATVLRGHWCPECAWLDRSINEKKRRKYEAVAMPDISPPPREK